MISCLHDISVSEYIKVKSYMYVLFSGKRIRRAIIKQQGKEISIPIPRANKSIQNDIKSKVASGEYNLGVPVLETNCTKLVLSANGEIEKKELKLSARKYPFSDIRKNSLSKNSQCLHMQPDEVYENISRADALERLVKLHEKTCDETADPIQQLKTIERTQNWLVWHDHSGLGNRGLMLFLMRELYDSAIHLTNEEFEEKHVMKVNVQSIIEQPHLYMMGVSGGADADQMVFIPTRRECLQGLSQPIQANGVKVKASMRFMNGDNASVEFEDGMQKGGHWGCSGCDGDIRRAGEYDYMAYRQYKPLKQKKNMVMAGIEGKKGKLYPFKNLKVKEIREELIVRGESGEGLTPELQGRLSEVLGGTTRLPALLYDTNHTLTDLNLNNYEVLFFEPLHCCLNQISNILQELPHHLQDVDTLRHAQQR